MLCRFHVTLLQVHLKISKAEKGISGCQGIEGGENNSCSGIIATKTQALEIQ
jgi:hypothetical protein